MVNTKAAIRQRIRSCKRCPLHATVTAPVPFTGPSPATIAVVGEAPGETEDLANRPFVGPSGSLLRTLLRDARLNPSTIFFCNVVSCRPPGNTTPTRAWIDACRSNLALQLAYARPTIILLAGSVALNAFLPHALIGKIRGRPFFLHDRPTPMYFPVYHPAYAMRDRTALDYLEADIATLGVIARQAPDWWDLHIFPDTCELCDADVVTFDEHFRGWCGAHSARSGTREAVRGRGKMPRPGSRAERLLPGLGQEAMV